MFKLKNNIAVKIQHIHNGRPSLIEKIKNCNGYTVATITRKVNDDVEVLASGLSQCNKLDQFNKRTGRIKAIGAAIGDLKKKHPELYDEVKSQVTLR